jgi:two-component system, cell cycle sensor histidine kinase and response regulator CckA
VLDFRALFENSPNPILVFDGNSQIIAANDAACEHFGLARDELLGREVTSVCGLGAAFRPVRVEFDGQPASVAILPCGRAPPLEERLRESEERYRLLFDAIPLPVVIWEGATGRYLAVNDSAVKKYGWSRDEFLQMTIFDVRSPEDAARLKEEIKAFHFENFSAGVWTHLNRAGEAFEVDVTTHAVEFAGRPARLAVLDDVTERRRLEEQLRQSQKMEATGLLAGGVAHDFNNLLGVVIGATELARRASPSLVGSAYLDEIDAAAKRGAELTRKLLAFSRKQVLKVRALDLGATIGEFVPLLRRVIREDIELVVRRPPQPLAVMADALQLEQVLLNLCTNAREAMPSGGRIVIELRHSRFDARRVSREPWASIGDYAEVRVVDTGVGMDEATRARIFEPFFSTRSEGTGLGLAMVHGIIHQHRGFLNVESRPGEGTTIRVLLPLAKAAERDDQRRVSHTPMPGAGETILLAEDEPALRRLLASTLVELGYDVVVAENGEEAVRTFESRRGRIALAILDVVMPILGGLQACRRMRELEPGVKVIFMTGYAPESAQMSELLTGGGHALLTKPFTLKELGRKVRDTLDEAKPGSE